MGITDMRPEQRVFRIDTECYIVYLGRHPNDYKPFLRIGNTPALDQEVKSLIYSVVVSDDLTGNPLDEAATISEVPNDEFRYIGDPKTVKKFKEFLKHQEIPTGKYQSNGAEAKNEHGFYVYFYDDANLRLRFETRPIFDLHIREERDRHFPQRCKEIKNAFLKDPLRQGKRALEKPGFFVVAGKPYVFSRSNTLSFGLEETTYVDLATRGIDPDAVTTAIHENGDLALQRWLKRLRQKNARGKVFTNQPDAVRGLIDLFRSLPAKPARVEQVRFEPGGRQSFFELTVHRRADQFLVDTHNGVTLALPAGSLRDAGEPGGAAAGGADGSGADSSTEGAPEGRLLRVDADGLHWRLDAAKAAGPILEGVPYRLSAEPPAFDEALVGTCIPQKPGDYTGVFSDEQVQILDQLRAAFEGLLSARDVSGPGRAIRSIGKAAADNPSAYFALTIHNARELIRLLNAGSRVKDAVAKGAANLDKALRALETPLEEVAVAGLICTLYVGNPEAYQLFPLADAVTADRLERSAALKREMREGFFAVDEEVFAAERKRLDAVIAELHPRRSRERTAEQGVVSAAGASEDEERQSAGKGTGTGAEGEAEGAASGTRESGPEASDERASGTTEGEAEAAAASRGGRRAADSTTSAAAGTAGAGGAGAGEEAADGAGRRRRGFIAAAAAVIIVVALFAVLFATGVIGGPGAGVDVRDGAEVAGTDETDTDDGTDGAATDGDGPAATDGSEGTDGAATGDDSEADGRTGQDEGPTADEMIGDTTNVSPEIRQFIESLDLENPPPGLRAREGAGGIIVTILDIIRLANRIAVDNGYRELGAPPSAGPDPDWIYPGNVFELPDDSTYTVVSGDTLWDITARFILEQLRSRYERFAALMNRYRAESISEAVLVDELNTLRDSTYSENFRNIIDRTIEEVQEAE